VDVARPGGEPFIAAASPRRVMAIAPGTQAPDFEVEAAVSGKTVTPAMGRKLVLVLHGPKTQEAPKEVGKAVRAAHPSADDVLVANVVNLKSMAGLWQKVARAQINSTYERMAAKIGDGAEDYVLICPDWDNAVGPLLGVEDSDRTAAVVVLDAGGKVIASHEGDGLGDAALAALAG
jgi:hypothetical protein